MTPLPIDETLPEILASLERCHCLVVVAPPGAGKTTRLPPALVRSPLLTVDNPGVIVLQPRRVATRAVAARIGEEQGWQLGQEVGYQVRLERRTSARTRLTIQTEGILNRRLLADPFLEGIGAVILDEFHERSLHSDLALALLNEVRREVRPDLMVIVMSATLEAAPVARYLGDCPIIEVAGRKFLVAIEYRPSVRPASPEAVAPVVRELLSNRGDSGHVLVFLPGMAEIRKLQREIEPVARDSGCEVIPLHGSLPAEDQDRALRPGTLRKVILATNIAETSLTIDGVSTVIDSGLARVAHHDPRRGLDRLDLQRISQASAEQRAGRAGRTGPGRCIRLWSEREQGGRAPFELPEVQRVDLCGCVLSLHSWGVNDPRTFAWYEPPADDRLSAAEHLLASLGAIEPGRGSITPLGRTMLGLPVHPRLSRLLIAAAEAGRAREGAALAALLSEKDILESSFRSWPIPGSFGQAPDRGLSDLLPRLDALTEAEAARFSPGLRSRGIDTSAARQAARVRDELLRLIRRSGPEPRGFPAQETDEDLLKWLILAYPDRLVRRRGSDATGVMVGGRGVRLSQKSIVREGEFFLALDPRQQRNQGTLELQVSMASSVQLVWLEELTPHLLRRERRIEYDVDRQRVVGLARLWYLDLLLREEPVPPDDPIAVSLALAQALRPRAAAILQDDPAAAAWLARYAFVRRAVPELGWPEFDDSEFAAILEVLCQGRTRADELRGAEMVPFLQGRLSPVQRLELDQCAPPSLQVPSGRQVRLTYEPDRPPVLAVRLQELFGWTETPRLARGRVPVLLHLLGPNNRPVQITSDLRSFWSTTYMQVRKDLRARYPKHSWPEDPYTASATAGPKRKRE
jgi:ATP-dependent helicase HrpB